MRSRFQVGRGSLQMRSMMQMPSAMFFQLFVLLTGLAFAGLVAAHEENSHFRSDVSAEAKPWTHLNFQNDPDDFQFAIVSDNTGGWRDGVFQDAVNKLNQLMPEFVISVGDYIKGNTRDAVTNAREWDVFTAMTQQLKMPFFSVAGNHDIQMKWVPGRVQPEEMLKQWKARFGPTYYSFVYKNTLFVALFSNDGLESRSEQEISEEQVAYFERTMAEHPDVRRTFVFVHHPLWRYPHQSNFDRVEAALAGRPYTVIAGHQHRYMHFERNDANYYILATTGGSSKLRGDAFGEFDHVSWVTMTDDEPILTNLRLDGILPHDVFTPDSVGTIRALEESGKIETGVLFGAIEERTSGSAFLAFGNASDRPVQLDGEFRYHRALHPRPGRVSQVLAPWERRVLQVDLKLVEPSLRADASALQFSGHLGYADGEAEPGPRLPVNVAIPLDAPSPAVFVTERREFVGSTTIAPRFPDDSWLARYTVDGSVPTRKSPRLAAPRSIHASAEVKARLYTRSGVAGPVETLLLEEISAGQGLLCHYYEHPVAEGNVKAMPVFAGLPPTYTKRVANFDLDRVARRQENYAIVFYGWLRIDEPGEHAFHVASADGARLFIDGQLVVNDPIKHPLREASGTARLRRGRRAIELHFYQSNHTSELEVAFTPPDGGRRPIPDGLLSFDEGSKARLISQDSIHAMK